MTLPVVKPDLIRTLGEQMRDREYTSRIHRELVEENEHLAVVCRNSVLVLDKVAQGLIDSGEYGEVDEKTIEWISAIVTSAYTVGTTTYLLMYQALKQQGICDELNG